MQAPEFWAGDGNGKALGLLLAPLGMAYDLAGRLRRALVSPVNPGVPVICIGNLVAGGAGKTPIAMAIAARLRERGRGPHLLTRGYGGQEKGPLRVDRFRHDVGDVGDEALLLAKVAPTWVARDRRTAARGAVATGAKTLILDDGFQNPRLAKDLSILVVDGAYGFGNGRVIPAGPLREPPRRGLGRADAVVLMGEDERGLAEPLRSEGRGAPRPLLRARLVPEADGPTLEGRRVLAFAGIGRPEKFFETLAGLGAELVDKRRFPDHHRYSSAEIEVLRARARQLEASPVTTEKDIVRLPRAQREGITTLAVKVVWDDTAPLDALLDRLYPE